MSLSTQVHALGERSYATLIHPDFWSLHSRLSKAPEVAEMMDEEITTHAFFELYPVTLQAYVPFFNEFFSDRTKVKELCELATIRENLVDTCVCMMADAKAFNAVFKADLRDPQVKEFLRSASSEATKLGTLFMRVELQNRVIGVLDTMLLLSAWGAHGFQNMPEKNQAQLIDHIAGLKAFFGA